MAEVETLEQRVKRLEKFVGPAPYAGTSGYDIYPGGIFCKDGPNEFYQDLRTILTALREKEAECDERIKAGQAIAQVAKDALARAEAAESRASALSARVEGLEREVAKLRRLVSTPTTDA